MAMEDIFNSPVLIKLQAFGQKLGANRFVSALQNSMMSMMSVLMVGAISQIVVLDRWAHHAQPVQYR